MKTEVCFPYGLRPEMEDQIFDFGMEFTEYVARTLHMFLVTGAMANEIYLHTDVRMK